MKIVLKDILSGEFGHIREYVHNEDLDWTLIDSGKFQFVINNQNEILFNNLNNHFKIVSNTFKYPKCIIIEHDMVFNWETANFKEFPRLRPKKTNRHLNYQKNDISGAFVNSIDSGNKLIIFDEEILIIYNTVLNKSEFILNFGDDISGRVNKRTKTLFDILPYYDLTFYGLWPHKLVVSSDEKYFYIISAAEGMNLTIFDLSDYSICYNEVGSYAIECGVFYKNFFILTPGFDLDADNKTNFKVVNLDSGELNEIEADIAVWQVAVSYDSLIVIGSVHNSEILNGDILIKAYDLPVLVNYAELHEHEIATSNSFYNSIFISKDSIYLKDDKIKKITYSLNKKAIKKSTKKNYGKVKEEQNLRDKIIESSFSDLEEDEIVQLERYIKIFKEKGFKEHWEVNNIITKNNEWDSFKRLRSYNNHGNNKVVKGILPVYFAIVCNVLRVAADDGDPLLDAKPY